MNKYKTPSTVAESTIVKLSTNKNVKPINFGTDWMYNSEIRLYWGLKYVNGTSCLKAVFKKVIKGDPI